MGISKIENLDVHTLDWQFVILVVKYSLTSLGFLVNLYHSGKLSLSWLKIGEKDDN